MAAAALFAGVSACATLQPFEAPAIELQPIAQPEHAYDEHPRNVASVSRYWQLLDDPEMARLLKELTVQNLSLQSARARSAQAWAAAREAGAAELPAIEAQTGASDVRPSLDTQTGEILRHSPYFRRNAVSADAGIGADWEVDFGQGQQHLAKAQRALAAAAESNVDALRSVLIGQAADAVIQIRALQARLAMVDDATQLTRELLEFARIQQAVGSASPREVTEAEAALAHQQSIRPSIRLALMEQGFRLDLLLGQQAGHGEGSALASSLAPPVPPVLDPVYIDEPRALLRSRPDIIAAEHHLVAAHERVGVAISGFYPKLSLSALIGFAGMTGTSMIGQDALAGQGAIGLRWRLFAFGRVRAEVDQANAAEKADIADYEQVVQVAVAQVQNALAHKQQLAAQSQQLSWEVTARTQSRAQMQAAFQAGSSPAARVIQADLELIDAKLALMQSRYDEERALVEIFQALGGG